VKDEATEERGSYLIPKSCPWQYLPPCEGPSSEDEVSRGAMTRSETRVRELNPERKQRRECEDKGRGNKNDNLKMRSAVGAEDKVRGQGRARAETRIKYEGRGARGQGRG
jgi:hypothetical protein